jgi:DNA segregation ATPase FtsK/SpoIIIE-like protein
MRATFLARLGVVLFVLGLVTTSWAIIPEDLVPKLNEEINNKAETAVSELVNEKRICRELWCEWPLTEVKHSPAQIEKAVDQKATAMANQKYPDSKGAEYQQQAFKMFPLYEIGDKVTLHPAGRDPVEGILRDRTATHVKVNITDIRLTDLPESDLVHFNVQLSQRKADEFVNARMAEWRTLRAAAREQYREQIADKAYTAYGYIRVEGRWLPKKDYVEAKILEAQQKVRDEFEPLARVQVYLANNLVKYSGEWMTAEEAEAKRQAAGLPAEGTAPAGDTGAGATGTGAGTTDTGGDDDFFAE